MDVLQVTVGLSRLFQQEGHRIVFWNDPERELQNVLPFLALDGVTVLRSRSGLGRGWARG